MIDEKHMKRVLQAYIDGFAAGDAAAVAALFADDATIEDPVGKPSIHGKDAITTFYTRSMKTGAKLALAAPIRASQGREAAMAFDVNLTMPGAGRAVIRVIDVMRFNDDGKIDSMRAFWGLSDMEMG